MFKYYFSVPYLPLQLQDYSKRRAEGKGVMGNGGWEEVDEQCRAERERLNFSLCKL